MAKSTENNGQEENQKETVQDNPSNESGTSEKLSLREIGIRLLYSLLFLIIFAIVETIVQITVLFQFIHLFFIRRENDAVRNATNKLSTYAYKVLRYLTMNEHQRPFPFTDWPEALEPPEGSEHNQE